MSRLTDLLREVERTDPALAADLTAEYAALSGRREFGLNFERHAPETVELPGRAARRGDKVRFLPERGSTGGGFDRRTWRVLSISRTDVGRTAKLVHKSRPDAEPEFAERDAENLVVVAEFPDPIYPGLVSVGAVRRGGDKPFHTVINAENFHALQALLYTHEGKVDVIYIDPPYNTGARDWKYNNDYVDDDDIYRHSKWLAFIERRLRLARKLLNPEESVLIVTIDEHEVHRLRLLIEQTFNDAYVQMVTIVVNPKGVAQGRFARVEEYALYCFFGAAGVNATDDDLLSDGATQRNTRFWKGLLRAGTNARPTDGLGMVYPIFIDRETSRMVSTGKTLRERIADDEIGVDPNSWLPDPGSETDQPGTDAVWPLRRDGSLGVWQAVPETLLGLAEQGLTKCVLRPDGWAISYVPNGVRAKIDSGEIAVLGYDETSGAATLQMKRDMTRAKTVWKRARHDAGWHGSVVLRKLLNARVFDFPKSLYAVRDALEVVVGNKPDAVVLDFFAGSGTTAHAVAVLNQSDGGRRQSISITNNEVSSADQIALGGRSLRAGDADWESLGIFEHVTRPRITAAISGVRPDGEPVELEYEDGTDGSDGFAENVEFFKLTYESNRTVAHNRAFEAVAPLLWLRAGATGGRIDTVDEQYAITDSYGVLFDLDHSRRFLTELSVAESVCTAFIVTDDDRSFQMVCSELPRHIEPVRLYESYLTNFTINTGRGVIIRCASR